MVATNFAELVALCKKRGFIFQNGEIYGGLQGVYDFGPLGVEVKNNLKAAWWRANVYERDDMYGLDSAILSHRLVLNHSGHEDTFADQMVDCKECKSRWRADHLVDGKCEKCGSTDLTEPRAFNMMFKTNVGPVVDEDSYAYLRPETAQGIFSNFKNVLDSMSPKLPFGIAQIGKAFRNEITPRNFIFRVREFEQMEIEFFVKPGDDETIHQQWIKARYDWWLSQGLSADNLQLQEQTGDELAHYAKATTDILYRFPHGLEELEGVANRTDFDLGSHTKAQDDFNLSAKVKANHDSTTKLNVSDAQSKESFIPYVIEPSAGVERGVLAVLTEAYHEEALDDGKKRVVLKLKPHLAPIKVAVIPLARNNEKIVTLAKSIKQDLLQLGIGRISYEPTGNIGKGYRRHDEIGTPLCITVDFDSIGESDNAELKDTVTVRDRDTMQQERIKISDITDLISKTFN